MKLIKKISYFITTQWLLVSSVVGVIVGCSVGVLLNNYNAGFYWFMWLGLPGELFLQALQMAVVPVIVSNLLIVAARTNPLQQGKVIGIILMYGFTLSILGSYMAIVLTFFIKPGVFINNSTWIENKTKPILTKQDGLGIHELLSDLLRNLIPSNLVRDCISTKVSKMEISRDEDNRYTYKLTQTLTTKTNLLGLMTASILFGIFCGKKPTETKPLIDLAESISMVATEILKILIKTLPVSVGSLMISSVSGIDSLTHVLYGMGIFVCCVLLALFIIHLMFHPLVFWIFVRRNPLKFLMFLFKPWLTAFTTTSSLMTFPVLQSTLIEFGLKENIVKMVLPLSLNVGSIGSMTFVSAACVFISQLQGQPLNSVSMIALGILSPINVIALPSIPSASLMAIIVILEGLQTSSGLVPLLFATEFILDRFRTGTNIITMSIGCAIIDRISAQSPRSSKSRNIELNIQTNSTNNIEANDQLVNSNIS